jgi:hypothetical protein
MVDVPHAEYKFWYKLVLRLLWQEKSKRNSGSYFVTSPKKKKRHDQHLITGFDENVRAKSPKVERKKVVQTGP